MLINVCPYKPALLFVPDGQSVRALHPPGAPSAASLCSAPQKGGGAPQTC